jgi:hypothetical protein
LETRSVGGQWEGNIVFDSVTRREKMCSCAQFLGEQGDKSFCMERFQEIEIEWEDYEKLLMYYEKEITSGTRAEATLLACCFFVGERPEG